MKLVMHRFEPLLVDVRVDLGGRDVGVPQHFLDDAQIRAVVSANGWRSYGAADADKYCLEPGTPCHRLHDLPDAHRR